MFNIPLINQTLIEPISRGAEELLIVSGYATPTMASWHMTKIKELSMPLIGIKLIVGMTNYDGLTKDVHEGFKQLVYAQSFYVIYGDDTVFIKKIRVKAERSGQACTDCWIRALQHYESRKLSSV